MLRIVSNTAERNDSAVLALDCSLRWKSIHGTGVELLKAVGAANDFYMLIGIHRDFFGRLAYALGYGIET